MNQNGIDVQVCVENRPIREFGHNGRTIVEGRKGTPFTIKVRNNHPTRVHAAVLVDGVGVVSGKEGDLKGYILEAYSSYEIKGWRQSLNDVARFVFQSKSGSYSKAVKGHDAQCGVISVVAYAEKPKPPSPQIVIREVEKHVHHHHDHWPYPYRRPHYPWDYPAIYCSTTGGAGGSAGPIGASGPEGCEGMTTSGTLNAMSFSASFSAGGGGAGGSAQSYSGAPAKMSKSAKRSLVSPGVKTSVVDETSMSVTSSSDGGSVTINCMNLGTGWGESQRDEVNEVPWENGAMITTMEMFYTDAEGLKILGIDTSKAPNVPAISGFPTGFCRPPAFEYAKEPATAAPAETEPKKSTKKAAKPRKKS
jgi:hypothetical protein